MTACSAVAAARALLMALRDNYVAAGLSGMAIRSFAENLLESLGIAVPVAVGLALLGAWLSSQGRGRAWILIPTALIAYLFIVGRLPRLPLHTFGLSTPPAIAGHVAAAAAATVAALGLTFAGRSRLARGLGLLFLSIVLASVLTLRLPGAPRASWPQRPNVILISLDTVRADHLGCYGYPEPTSPAIDRFAAGATRFTQAFTVQPWTLTAHISMLTGLYPEVHRIRHGRRLSPRIRTLAEAFRDAGYLAAAVVDTVPWMDPRFGFDSGFHIYRTVRGSAANKNEHVLYLLDDLEERPFFLFVHYYDAHSDWHRLPYDSDDEDRARFAGWYRGEFTGCDSEDSCATHYLKGLNERRHVPPPEDLRYMRSLYDGGIRSMDRHLGSLFETLERRGLMERSVVLLTSDHGEEFFEHGMALHLQAYEECLRVPLIVHVPGGTKGRVTDLFVSLVDIAPTLMDLGGIDPGVTNGESFKEALVQETDSPTRDLILIAGDQSLGLRSPRHKFIDRGEQVELFDLVRDPGEQANLAAAGLSPEREATWRRRLERERATAQRLVADFGFEPIPFGSADGGPGQSLTDEDLEQLRALGYLSSATRSSDPDEHERTPR